MRKSYFAALATPLLSFSLLNAAPATYELLFDPHMSPYSGGEDIVTAHRLLEVGEDRLNLFQGRNTLARLGRLIELTIFWAPLNIFLDVTQHEVFGHGYRIRDLGPNVAEVNGYVLSTDGGSTSFSISEDMTLGQYSAIDVAGLEAEAILSEIIKSKWMTANTCYARQNSMYVQSKLSPLFYSLTLFDSSVSYTLEDGSVTPSGKPDISSGHDIETYKNLLNTFYPGANLTNNDLIHASLWNLLDLTIYNSIVSWWKYLIYGENASYWMIPIKDNIRYLPSVSSVFAPYGIEYRVSNYLMISSKLFSFYGKGGSHMGHSFGGGGFYAPSCFEGKYGQLGFLGDFWSQPNFLDTATIEDWDESTSNNPAFPIQGSITGGNFGGVAHVNLLKNKKLQFITIAGYKTKGYIPGYSLTSGGYIRAGLATQF